MPWGSSGANSHDDRRDYPSQHSFYTLSESSQANVGRREVRDDADNNVNLTDYSVCSRQEELFGPVLCVKKVQSLEEAIEIINHNRYVSYRLLFIETRNLEKICLTCCAIVPPPEMKFLAHSFPLALFSCKEPLRFE